MLLHIGLPLWAVTINPSPNKFINKKRWQTYPAIRQQEILTRVLSQLTLKNPSINLLEHHFEKCPSNGQIHVHALFECTLEWVSTIENWIHHSIEWKDDKSTPRWRHLVIDPIYNRLGWEAYIRKDQ